MKELLVVTTLLVFMAIIQADFEDQCRLLKEYTATPSSLILSLTGGGTNIDLKINDPALNIIERTSIQLPKVEGYYDGFYCRKPPAEKYSPKFTEPCKNYISLVEMDVADFPGTIVCFRYEPLNDPGSTELIVVLNKAADSQRNPFQLLLSANSYIVTMRFLYSLISWISKSLDYIVPHVNEKDVEHHWAWNLVAEATPSGYTNIRYRYINVHEYDSTEEGKRRVVIESAFSFLKNFYYFGSNCKQIVMNMFRETQADKLWLHLKQSPGFPSNFATLYNLIQQGYFDKAKRPSKKSFSSMEIHHDLLVKSVVLGYCVKEIRYAQQQLDGLQSIISSIFAYDKFFDKQKEAENFRNYFLDHKEKLPENQASTDDDFGGRESPMVQLFNSLLLEDHPKYPPSSVKTNPDNETH